MVKGMKLQPQQGKEGYANLIAQSNTIIPIMNLATLTSKIFQEWKIMWTNNPLPINRQILHLSYYMEDTPDAQKKTKMRR